MYVGANGGRERQLQNLEMLLHGYALAIGNTGLLSQGEISYGALAPTCESGSGGAHRRVPLLPCCVRPGMRTMLCGSSGDRSGNSDTRWSQNETEIPLTWIDEVAP